MAGLHWCRYTVRKISQYMTSDTLGENIRAMMNSELCIHDCALKSSHVLVLAVVLANLILRSWPFSVYGNSEEERKRDGNVNVEKMPNISASS